MTTANIVKNRRESWIVKDFNILKNVFAKTVHLDVTNGNASNKGTGPRDAVLTIKQALALSAVWDSLLFAPGTYPVDVGDASVKPLAFQQWQSALPTIPGGMPSVIIVADADDNVATPVAVDVDGVIFDGIEFKLVAGGTNALYCIEAAQTTAVRGLTFINCLINLNGVDALVIGMKFDDASNAITGLAMRGCRLGGATATASVPSLMSIGVEGIPGCDIQDNVFENDDADGAGNALLFADPGAAAKSYGMKIANNDFIGPSDGGGAGVPITFNSSMTEDEIVGIIRTNYFSNVTTVPITIDKINNSVIRNYGGDDATGGTLVDPGT